MKSGSKNIPIGGDLFGQQMLEDPYSVYRELRERDPVHWDEHAKVWVLTRYDDVASMLNDKRFSSQRAARARQRFPQEEMKPLFETLTSRVSEKDEPDHTRLRALVHDAFTRSSVEQWEPLVQSRINHLLDLANAQRELEFVSGFAIPLPLMLIMEIVGVPPVDRQRIKAWCDDFANVALNFYANIMATTSVRERSWPDWRLGFHSPRYWSVLNLSIWTIRIQLHIERVLIFAAPAS